jgi:ubiquinone/menaquinone biosynthesis C-methylase UbiE
MRKNIELIGSKPVGIIGRLAGYIMNITNGALYKQIIHNFITSGKAEASIKSVLDIGCGGGKVVKIFYSLLKEGKICGIDHSIEMVKLSRKVNKKGIRSECVKILKADVKKIPYENNSFDMVTAFDTINFWEDYSTCCNEIKRVLKKQGVFLIVNKYPKKGSKWYEFINFKSDKEYRYFLSRNGFKDIEIEFVKNTIIIKSSI